MNYFIRRIEQLVFSNVYVSVAAVCMLLETVYLLDLNIDEVLPLIWMVFFSTLFTYNFQRLARMEGFVGHKNDRLSWISQQKKKLIALAVLSLLGMLYTIFLISIEVTFTLIAAGLVSVLYPLPVIKLKGRWHLVRELPFVKIFLISITWTVATVFIVYIDQQSQLRVMPIDWVLIAFQRFIFIFSITLPFDIRDMEYDKERRLQTIPLVLGVANTKRLAIGLQLFAIVLAIVQFYQGTLLLLSDVIGLTMSYILTAVVLYFVRKNSVELYFSGLIEGMMILQLLLIWSVRCIV